ncbi:MAG: 50S ribosomal protein L19 [Christensenellaceae bacterium]|jgi:large subunit ribosomal protein L19|nr:50S ribosomal protein L19 [Christensenellaceae bacterium]
MNLIDIIEKENLKENVPQFDVGDTVKVYVKIIEGNKERLQGYEGVVIARRHGSVRESFTVRRLSYGVGVERTFPLHSPKVDRVEVLKKGKVRRAKLFYLRERTGNAAKIQEKREGKNTKDIKEAK